MIGKWCGLDPMGKTRVVEEGGEFIGGTVEVMVPVNNANIIRVCIRKEDNSLKVAKIIEEAFLFCSYDPNGKGYKDYPMDVREKMNLFTKDERAERKKSEYHERRSSAGKAGGAW